MYITNTSIFCIKACICSGLALAGPNSPLLVLSGRIHWTRSSGEDVLLDNLTSGHISHVLPTKRDTCPFELIHSPHNVEPLTQAKDL
jgi:hypothetical protein